MRSPSRTSWFLLFRRNINENGLPYVQWTNEIPFANAFMKNLTSLVDVWSMPCHATVSWKMVSLHYTAPPPPPPPPPVGLFLSPISLIFFQPGVAENREYCSVSWTTLHVLSCNVKYKRRSICDAATIPIYRILLEVKEFWNIARKMGIDVSVQLLCLRIRFPAEARMIVRIIAT